MPVNRIEFKQEPGKLAIVFKLRGRVPEGVILDRAQVEAIGYDFFLLEEITARCAVKELEYSGDWHPAASGEWL